MSKRAIYIFLFTMLGVFVSFLAHAAIEMSAIKLLLKDFETYNLGLTWKQWFLVHHIGAVLLFALGAGAGYWQGIYWWRKIYGDQ